MAFALRLERLIISILLPGRLASIITPMGGGGFPGVDYEVNPGGSVYKILRVIPGFFKKVRDKIFKKLFGLCGVCLYGIEEGDKVGFEPLNGGAFRAGFDKGFVEGFVYRNFRHLSIPSILIFFMRKQDHSKHLAL
jgi:hypothetical protein